MLFIVVILLLRVESEAAGEYNIRFNHGFEVFNVCCGPIEVDINARRTKQRSLISTKGRNEF